MTMIDDDQLRSLFRRAGDAITVPESGPADILRRAAGSTAETVVDGQASFDLGDGDPVTAVHPLRIAVRRHKVLSVAAAVVVLAAVAGGTIAWQHRATAPTITSSEGAVPTTTLPPTAHVGTDTFGVSGAPAKASASAPSAGSTTSGAATSNSALPQGAVGQSSRIEQTGSLDLVVPKGTLSTVMTKLTFLASANNGFVANSQTQTGAGTPTGSLTLEVPVASFTSLLSQAQALGHTSALSTKATDVTGQYVDLQARISALQASRQQYLTIMSKATSIGDILSVQAQLDSIQSQIEQLQGQLQVLSSETAYSTLNVLVSERGTVHHHPSRHPASGLLKAWDDSVHGFVTGVEGVIRLAGPVLFALLCLAVLVIGGRLSWRRLQRHNL